MTFRNIAVTLRNAHCNVLPSNAVQYSMPYVPHAKIVSVHQFASDHVMSTTSLCLSISQHSCTSHGLNSSHSFPSGPELLTTPSFLNKKVGFCKANVTSSFVCRNCNSK